MKPKRCKSCREQFVPATTLQRVCSPRCALRLVREQAKAAQRKKDRETKRKLKTRRDWMNEAQAEFNRYILARDRGEVCISCGAFPNEQGRGGSFDAGHYRSRGANPELRFHEDNCHAQCKKCNRYLSGNVVNYRVGLIQKLGIERVESLESHHPLRRWTIDDLKQIKATYKRKTAELAEETR